MKKLAIAALFVLGFIELLFPVGVALMFYAYDPKFRNAFDLSKLTDQQRQLCEQFHAAMNARCKPVFYYGLATILIGIILLVPDKKRKPDAQPR